MASPQIEKGYTRIANELLEAMYLMPRSDYEHRVFLLIIRFTYGYNKKSDWISLSQICHETGIAKPNASRTIKKLIQKNMIVKEGRRSAVQKNYEAWMAPGKVPRGKNFKQKLSTGVENSKK